MSQIAKHVAVALLCLAAPSGAEAGDLVFGVGPTDYHIQGTETETNFTLEIHSRPFAQPGRFSFGTVAAASVSSGGDIWVGVGLAAKYDLNNWFVEASLMPGFYQEGSDATDLGSAIEFRSLIGLGYSFSPSTSLSVAFEHKSNAGIGERNPGVEAFSLRLRKSF